MDGFDKEGDDFGGSSMNAISNRNVETENRKEESYANGAKYDGQW